MKWINRIFARRKDDAPLYSGASAPVIEKKGTTEAVEPAAQAEHGYSSDQPIRSKSEDRFNRWAFAKRIADTFASRNDVASIVIGLYGPWGDGKTSTLRLMEAALQDHAHVVVVRFNPWHFQSQDQLLRGFFATLAEALGKSLPTMREDRKDHQGLRLLAFPRVDLRRQRSKLRRAKRRRVWANLYRPLNWTSFKRVSRTYSHRVANGSSS